MIDPQAFANDIRDRIEEHELARRLGIEVLRATGTPDGLTIRARHRDRILTVERDPGWVERGVPEVATEIVRELAGDCIAAGSSPVSRPRRPVRDRRRARRW